LSCELRYTGLPPKLHRRIKQYPTHRPTRSEHITNKLLAGPGSRYRDTAFRAVPHASQNKVFSCVTEDQISPFHLCIPSGDFLPDDDVIGYTAPRGGISKHHSLFYLTVLVLHQLYFSADARGVSHARCGVSLTYPHTKPGPGPKAQSPEAKSPNSISASQEWMDFSMRAKAIADLA
jgi:hypothetical protein